ncbi:SanA/YdcF family protein [Flavisericum labens]|uniref:SanA/YdcF family protein n=1 Tax=Flavisericum labens TaxID=3377112 RepID=UPI00387B7421
MLNKKHFKKVIYLILFVTIYSVCLNFWITYQAKNSIYNNVDKIPKNKVGLILGANKFAGSGRINLYYKYRLNAAITLYKSGKIEYILISGDNSRKDYDEPSFFINDLIENGIPENKIYLDFAGFSTRDSMARANKIFGLNSLTIISQKFHNERAIYLAKHSKIKAIAFNATDLTGRYGVKTKLREHLARTKASIDILFNVGPKFLGEKIDIK